MQAGYACTGQYILYVMGRCLCMWGLSLLILFVISFYFVTSYIFVFLNLSLSQTGMFLRVGDTLRVILRSFITCTV
jgi:hypothetical protein